MCKHIALMAGKRKYPGYWIFLSHRKGKRRGHNKGQNKTETGTEKCEHVDVDGAGVVLHCQTLAQVDGHTHCLGLAHAYAKSVSGSRWIELYLNQILQPGVYTCETGHRRFILKAILLQRKI